MKAVILNGMHAGDDETASVHKVLLELLRGEGWEVEPFTLHQMAIRPCIGCFGCWLQTPGRCLMEETDGIARAHAQSDLMVLVTPITFGGYSSELKKAIDHLICAVLPFFQTVGGETHHRRRYERYPNLLAIGVLSQHDKESERIFARLVERNAINLWAPAWAAGTLARGEGDGTLRTEIQALLKQVEVA